MLELVGLNSLMVIENLGLFSKGLILPKLESPNNASGDKGIITIITKIKNC